MVHNNAKKLAPVTTLASERELKRRGRYTCVMGNLWRHPKREKCGRAAMGLLLDVWAYCADQGVAEVSARGMKRLLMGDPNGRRQLKELVAAGFLDETETGYAPHDWRDYNRTQATLDTPRDEDATRGVTRLVTRDEMKSAPDNTQETTASRAGAQSQVPSPSLKEEERETAPLEPAPPPKLVKPKEPKKRDQDKELFRKTVADEASKLGLLEFSIPSKYVDQVLAKAKAHAEQGQLSLEASIRQVTREGIQRQLKAGKEPKWGLVDWQPYAVVRDLRKPMPCAPRSAFSTLSIEEQAKAQGATGWFS